MRLAKREAGVELSADEGRQRASWPASVVQAERPGGRRALGCLRKAALPELGDLRRSERRDRDAAVAPASSHFQARAREVAGKLPVAVSVGPTPAMVRVVAVAEWLKLERTGRVERAPGRHSVAAEWPPRGGRW